MVFKGWIGLTDTIVVAIPHARARVAPAQVLRAEHRARAIVAPSVCGAAWRTRTAATVGTAFSTSAVGPTFAVPCLLVADLSNGTTRRTHSATVIAPTFALKAVWNAPFVVAVRVDIAVRIGIGVSIGVRTDRHALQAFVLEAIVADASRSGALIDEHAFPVPRAFDTVAWFAWRTVLEQALAAYNSSKAEKRKEDLGEVGHRCR